MFFHIFDIESGLCNLRCDYCFLSHGGIKETVRRGDNIYTKNNEGKILLDYSVGHLIKTIQLILDKVDACVLKVLGGEIFLLPEVLDLLIRNSDKYKKIRIITNGILLQKYNMAKISPKKFCFQVSLDGSNITSNRFRFSSKDKYLKCVLNNIKYLYERGFIVEINCVLTEVNIGQFKEFALFVKKQFSGIMIYPYPVRFFEKRHSLKPESAKIIESWLYEKDFIDILPPKPYMLEMINAINKQKELKCYLPIIAISGSEDGSINLCPCAMLEERDNLFKNNNPLKLTFNSKNVQDVLNWKYKVCKECFTHFDIVNLFIERRISDEEMLKKGMFQDEHVLEALIHERSEIEKELNR